MNNVCKIKREGFIFICIIECLNLWPNFLFSKSNFKKISQNIPNNPFYLKKHMRWTRRSLSSTINSNCTKLILKKIVLTQVLIWKGHFFFVFFTFQQIFSHMSYHHISLMCILLLCIVHERVNITICVMGQTQVKRTLWTPSNLTCWTTNSLEHKNRTLNPKSSKLWTCLVRYGLWI